MSKNIYWSVPVFCPSHYLLSFFFRFRGDSPRHISAMVIYGRPFSSLSLRTSSNITTCLESISSYVVSASPLVAGILLRSRVQSSRANPLHEFEREAMALLLLDGKTSYPSLNRQECSFAMAEERRTIDWARGAMANTTSSPLSRSMATTSSSTGTSCSYP